MNTIYAYQETVGDKFWHLADINRGNVKIENGIFYIKQLDLVYKDGTEAFHWDRMAKYIPVENGNDYPVPCVIHYNNLSLHEVCP